MLTDRQSLILSGIIVLCFVVTGILDILNNIYVASILILAFLLIVVNLLITKRVPEAEEDAEEEKKTSKKE